ncbi:single-stranded-DNA-specific exonuclease RecJ [Patescibacteria group bacterium]
MNWNIKNDEENLEKIDFLQDQSFSLHLSVKKILLSRGIDSAEKAKSFLFPEYEEGILDPFLFVDMKKVVSRIKDANEKGEKVLVFGDYDADGITATTILKETLSDLGVDTSIYIPDKEKEGYGLNKDVILKSKNHGFSLMITVDCGISNFEEVEYANSIGVDVIVTDHHHIPKKLPNAVALINPKIKDSGYPFDDLAGVGVAFKVAEAIYEKLMPQKKEQVKWLLDLVAIGTVADCVNLVEENRIIVKYGLLVLSKTRREGLQELFKTGRILVDENNIPDAQKISFQIAPRINAASRMSHAKLAYQLISEKDRVQARLLALEIEEQNNQRRKVTEQVVKDVEKIISEEFQGKKFIFAASEHFPMGITGLVAGRVAGKLSKPTGIVTKGEKESKGSFRSIPQLNIIDAIEKCSKWLEKFGGHAQAAGISIKNENIDNFYKDLNTVIEKELEGKDLKKVIEIDEKVLPSQLDFKLIDDIDKMRPFGMGNPEPVLLMSDLIIQELKWVGSGEKHLKLFLRPNDNSPKIFEAIGFNLNKDFGHLKQGDEVDLVFNIQKDEWNGNKKMQLRIVDLKACS